jgi:hypothetical protein
MRVVWISLLAATLLLFACSREELAPTPRTTARTEPKKEQREQETAARVVSRKLYPTDDSHLDPSFADTKSQLLAAIEANDREFLGEILAPQVHISSGEPVSRQQALAFFSNENGALWKKLRDLVLLGAVRFGDRFCLPSVEHRFPEELDIMEYVLIAGHPIPVREEPYATAPVITHLSFDIVRRDSHFTLWDRIEGEKHEWVKITTPDGRIGYVWGRYVWDTLEYGACFKKVDGHWRLVEMAAPDL